MRFFENINFVLVFSGCMLLGLGAGVIGCFAFLRKRSLLGDALAHAALPGVCGAFLLTGSKDPLIILGGAMVSCWLGAWSIDLLVKHTRVKEDSALGMVLSVYFGIGILMLTHIQQSGAAAQSGLDKFLFGQAAAMLDRDVWTVGGVSLVMITAVALAYKEFKVIAFDADFGAALGVPVRFIQLLLSTLIVMAVAVGLQAVGVVLMAAMLVTPAAAARYWTDRLDRLLILAGFMGALSGAIGTIISYSSPKMPTGPWMVVAISLIFFVSLVLAPRRGILPRRRRARLNQIKTELENILRTLYRQGEETGDWTIPRSVGDLLKYRPMPPARMHRRLMELAERALIRETDDAAYVLTEEGINRAARLTRLHRLWELYLTRKVEIAPDHVHEDAEEIEHILTPELEARLVAVLASPEEDPHARRIPGEILAVGATAGGEDQA